MAKRLIEKYGRTISILASSPAPANPAKPWRGSAKPHTEDDPTTVLAKGAFVGLSLAELGFTETDVDGQLHKRGAKFCLVAPSGLVPVDTDISQYDAILDGDSVWRIQKVHVLEPGDLRLFYAIEVVQ
jgi:hypothetical protein